MPYSYAVIVDITSVILQLIKNFFEHKTRVKAIAHKTT